MGKVCGRSIGEWSLGDGVCQALGAGEECKTSNGKNKRKDAGLAVYIPTHDDKTVMNGAPNRFG